MEKAHAPRLVHKDRKKAPASFRGFASANVSKDLVAYPNQIIPFPIDGIKERFEGYFSLAVRGSSLVEAGINDGDYMLIQRAEAPENGAIMLVSYEGHNTVKRVKIHNGRVFLCWEDGSGRKLEATSADYEVQGKFMAIERRPEKW